MTPSLEISAPPSSLYAEYVAELRLRAFQDDISVGDQDRTVFTTDNSVFQIRSRKAVRMAGIKPE